jgi:hypothetical protein
MDARQSTERSYVIYRGTGRGDRPVEVHLIAAPDAVTAADAWTRLARLDATVDPRSIEIETRRLPRRPGLAAAGRAATRQSSAPIDLARWLAARTAMGHHARP